MKYSFLVIDVAKLVNIPTCCNFYRWFISVLVRCFYFYHQFCGQIRQFVLCFVCYGWQSIAAFRFCSYNLSSGIKNEEWRMKNEEWRMKNEEWRMKNEEWRMKNEGKKRKKVFFLFLPSHPHFPSKTPCLSGFQWWG